MSISNTYTTRCITDITCGIKSQINVKNLQKHKIFNFPTRVDKIFRAESGANLTKPTQTSTVAGNQLLSGNSNLFSFWGLNGQ